MWPAFVEKFADAVFVETYAGGSPIGVVCVSLRRGEVTAVTATLKFDGSAAQALNSVWDLDGITR
jgi:hypothetical protein